MGLFWIPLWVSKEYFWSHEPRFTGVYLGARGEEVSFFIPIFISL